MITIKNIILFQNHLKLLKLLFFIKSIPIIIINDYEKQFLDIGNRYTIFLIVYSIDFSNRTVLHDSVYYNLNF